MKQNCMVILNYNDYITTSKYLDLIKDYKVLDLIVVVDNNSTDNSYKILKKYENKKIIVLKTQTNKGYSYGNNMGCKYIINKHKDANIIISNPDIIVDEDTISKLIDELTRSNKLAIIAPNVLQDNNIERGWKLATPLIDSLLNLPLIYRFLRKSHKGNMHFYGNNYYNKKISYVDVVTGCFFIIKSDIIKEAEYFDENVFLYGEEDILGKKLKSRGYKTAILNTVSVIHNHSLSIDKSLNVLNKIRIAKKSQLYFHKKYNNANFLSLSVLFLTGKISLLREYIKLVHRRFEK